MDTESEHSRAEDLFEPIPNELRLQLDGLGPVGASAHPGLPEWASTLIVHHSNGDLNLESLGIFSRDASDDPAKGTLTIGYEGVLVALLPGGESRAVKATPKPAPGDPWMYSRLVDYWDANIGAIEPDTSFI